MTTLNKSQYNALLSKGVQAQYHSLIGFAAACYDDNNFADLVTALDSEADATDCKAWYISAEEWRKSVKQALEMHMHWFEDENIIK